MPYEFDSYERYEYHRNENYNSNGFNMFDVLTPDALLLYEAADILENANYTKIETTRGTELRVTPPWDKRLRLDIRIYRMNGRPDMACIYIFGGVRKNEHFKGNDNITQLRILANRGTGIDDATVTYLYVLVDEYERTDLYILAYLGFRMYTC